MKVTAGPSFYILMIIEKPTDDATLNLVLDTLKKKKQAIVFVNSKRSAEKTAEDISKLIKNTKFIQLKEDILSALAHPTKQCERLSKCIERGIAFHHAGLVADQRNLIEDNFRNGTVKVICCTPTLAYGLDLPAYRVILKDLRRYSGYGLNWIPTLEYLQMAGRAGRPKFDNEGQAIAVAKTDAEFDEIESRYINGKPEEIFSKLAVEPVLRTYVLSLIATDFVNSKKQLIEFFERTFWAHQFEDMDKIEAIVEKVLKMLDEFEFITIEGSGDFVSADKLETGKIRATVLGKRVAELYIDPLTAYKLICCARKAANFNTRDFSFLHMVAHSVEMRPLLKVKVKEMDDIQDQLLKFEPYLLDNPPNLYDPEYDEFLASIKTALMMYNWINEDGEEKLLENYGIRPGELRAKINNADWLLYAAEELTRILNFRSVVKELVKLRLRLDYGVKEELLQLLQLKGIGRVRARRLFHNKFKTIDDLRKTDLATLGQIIGKGIAISVKKQLGEKITEKIIRKRQGQTSLSKF